MKIHFDEFKDEIEDLIEFMTSSIWEFHATPNSDPDRIRAAYEKNYYTGEGCKTFWLE